MEDTLSVKKEFRFFFFLSCLLFINRPFSPGEKTIQTDLKKKKKRSGGILAYAPTPGVRLIEGDVVTPF